MQSDKPPKVVRGRTTPRRGSKEAGEVLSPAEAARELRGQVFKRYVRAAAAMHGLYDDTAIGDAVGRSRIAVGKWWQGARPEPDTLVALARATGLSADELLAFVYNDGPPPTMPRQTPDPQVLATSQEWAQSVDVPSPLPLPDPPGGTPRS